MNKPTLLYSSPFPPQKSGISDYSVVLVKALAKRFKITLLTDQEKIEALGLDDFPYLIYGRNKVLFDEFDYRIYNIGNNPYYHAYIYQCAIEHPGLVILHDFSLYYLFVGFYQNRGCLYSAVYNKLGLEVFQEIRDAIKVNGPKLLEQKQLAGNLTMNEELLQSGNLFMVHSEYARNQILAKGLTPENRVKHINMISQVEAQKEVPIKQKRNALLEKYHIPVDAFLIASFGYIAETKRNLELCRAVRQIAEYTGRKICYVMVGEGNYVDQELEDGLIIKTGYIELDDFNCLIHIVDIVANLRFPTMGETSGAMLRIMQMGKPCLINEGGWFSEIPSDCVCRIGIDHLQEELEKALIGLIEDSKKCEIIGDNARRYVQEKCNPEKISQELYDFITAIHM